MNNGDGLWWLMAVVTGSVSTAMLIYGVRQKAPLPLVFGLLLGAVPMLTGSGWLATLITALLAGAFMILRKYI